MSRLPGTIASRIGGYTTAETLVLGGGEGLEARSEYLSMVIVPTSRRSERGVAGREAVDAAEPDGGKCLRARHRSCGGLSHGDVWASYRQGAGARLQACDGHYREGYRAAAGAAGA